jgi:hypothetical protein
MTTRSDVTAMVVPSLLLLLGAALGPHGLAILTRPALSFLDPAAPVALAVFATLAVLRGHPSETPQPFTAAFVFRPALTGLVVAGAFALVPPAAAIAETGPAWVLMAAALGIAAATSASVDDCVLPIVAGGILLAFLRESTMATALLATLQMTGIAIVIAGAGWLLLSRASSTDEQRVSTFAGALLLGGAADYLSMSALLCGAAAGACWRLTANVVRENILRDLIYVSDSLLALVLILAGAHADYSLPAMALGAAYAALRTTGKLGGQWITRRIRVDLPHPAGRHLLIPGALGVAFALNVVRGFGDAFAPIVTIVVVGTILSSVIAALFPGDAAA